MIGDEGIPQERLRVVQFGAKIMPQWGGMMADLSLDNRCRNGECSMRKEPLGTWR